MSEVKGKTVTVFDYGPVGPKIELTIDHSALAATLAGTLNNNRHRRKLAKRDRATLCFGAIVARRIEP